VLDLLDCFQYYKSSLQHDNFRFMYGSIFCCILWHFLHDCYRSRALAHALVKY